MMISFIPAAFAAAPSTMTIGQLAAASGTVATSLQTAIKAGTYANGVYYNVIVPSEIAVGAYTMGVEDYVLMAAYAINDIDGGSASTVKVSYKNMSVIKETAYGINLTTVTKGQILDLARRVEIYGSISTELPASFNRPSDGSATYEGRLCIYSIGHIFAQALAAYAKNGSLPSSVTFVPSSYTTSQTSTAQEPAEDALPVSDEYANVIAAAVSFKAYVDDKEAAPSSVTVGSTPYGLSEFSHLIAQVIVNISNGDTTSALEILDLTEPSNPSETSTATTITQTEYLDLASRTVTWNQNNGVGANYMNSSIGHIHHHEAIYLYCQILAYYAENIALPSTANIYTWAKLTGFTAGDATFGADFSAYAKYLVPTANCQSTNATIISVAKTGMMYSSGDFGGYASPSNTYQAMFNLHEYLNAKTTYEYYMNTSRGALGTWNDKYGNCCDMAHLMIACARSLGVPGRYRHAYCYFTSGLEVGHVWADVFCGTQFASYDRYNSDGWLTSDLVSYYNYLGYKTNTSGTWYSNNKVAELTF